ncbi:MAG: helicase C-terminal domain-containing protein [Gemmatimonadota bacterium]
MTNPRAVARGNSGAVLAAAKDANPGEILIHNHPSGVLEPSHADLALAAHIYEEGLGSGIVDNDATALYVVVEPPEARLRETLDPASLEAYLAPGGALDARFGGYEDRPTQRGMLREVVARFNEGGVAVVEAATGTGKSLAYLLPAALWALRNGERTVVSTNTINLQEQLVAKDLPLVRDLVGEDFKWSLVKGRGNYVSIRRLHLARQSATTLFDDDRGSEIEALVDWVGTTRDGSLADLNIRPGEDVWDEVRSDGDICMGARCPHFQECFYQKARRRAAASDVLVVNHALLFADVSLRRTTDNWSQAAVLPVYRHVVLDEGHNVEDAATSHLGAEVTRIGMFRTLGRLERNGKGVLRSVEDVLQRVAGSDESDRLLDRIEKRLRPAQVRARESLTRFFDALEPAVPFDEEEPLRLGRGDVRDPADHPEILELLDTLTAAFGRLRRELQVLRESIEDDVVLLDALEGRVLDVRAVERRLEAAQHALGLVLDPKEAGNRFVRWIEGRGGRSGRLRNVILAAAPVEPGELLRESLFDRVDTAVITSATLATGGEDFRFIRDRLGLVEEVAGAPDGASTRRSPGPEEAGALAFADVVPIVEELSVQAPLRVTQTLLRSPFDYREQTLFCVPTDFPGHDQGNAFQDATARVVTELAGITDGGIFVLFTSYRALRAVAQRLRSSGVASRWPVWVHGEGPRSRLLGEFVRSGKGILLGTSSFWEGVDVPGDPLRGLILQKIPFRVPTEPITQARMEAIEVRGRSAFQSYLVPLAALRLKQGFGRLIRSRTDRGGILLLDPRIVTRSYGRVLRRALPDAPLVKGPWHEVRHRLEAFYRLPRAGGAVD